MLKKTISYFFLFFIQSLLFLFIIDNIFLPYLTSGKKEIYLPDVREMNIEDATIELDKFHIQVFNQKYTNGAIPGNVVSMSPHPFTLLKEGKIIKLTIVSNPEIIIVNSYIDKSFRDIKLKLDRKSIGIDTIIYEFNNNIKKGFIIDHYPGQFDTLKIQDKLTIIVSRGKHPNYYIVPNLVNLSLHKARQNISRSGLLLGSLKYEYNNEYLNNTILEQNHPPNKRLSFPAEIDLILSTDKRRK